MFTLFLETVVKSQQLLRTLMFSFSYTLLIQHSCQQHNYNSYIIFKVLYHGRLVCIVQWTSSKPVSFITLYHFRFRVTSGSKGVLIGMSWFGTTGNVWYWGDSSLEREWFFTVLDHVIVSWPIKSVCAILDNNENGGQSRSECSV